MKRTKTIKKLVLTARDVKQLAEVNGKGMAATANATANASANTRF